MVGHELTHGFDDQGQFDADGNLRDWWTASDKKQFEERTGCIKDQYASFVAVDDLKLNGKLTLGENTADNGGLRIAYVALLNTSCRQGAGADRRSFRRAALLSRICQRVVRESHRRPGAHVGHRRSALTGKVPGERNRLQYAGVPRGVSLYGDGADGESERVQGVVRGRRWSLVVGTRPWRIR